MSWGGGAVAKRRTSTNVVPIGTGRGGAPSKADKLHLAQKKVYDAWEASGETRKKLANEALAISEDCADAYLILAEELRDRQERINLFRKAIAAGRRALGSNWETKYKGMCWGTLETRTVMRAMARLAMDLQREDELTEALGFYRKLMELNPNDNQGIRYLLANCLYEARCDSELEKLLSEYSDDCSAALLYTKALHLFLKTGASKRATKALNEAFQENVHVPIFLSDIVEMPDEPPESIGFGDDREAVAYVMDHGYLWHDTEGAVDWMAETLAPEMRKVFEDQELVEEVIKALRGEYDD